MPKFDGSQFLSCKAKSLSLVRIPRAKCVPPCSIKQRASMKNTHRCLEDLACYPLERACGNSLAALPQLHIAKDGVSISGLSSGADFVVQFQVAFSEVVKGLGVFAGQPYHCAVQMFEGDKLVNESTRLYIHIYIHTHTHTVTPGNAGVVL